MNLLMLTLFITVLVAAAAFVFYRWRVVDTDHHLSEPSDIIAPSRPYLITQWHCVRIRPGLICCEQARKMSDQLYLTGDAPALPLAECTEMNCSCHYLHFGDRRIQPERRIKIQKLTAIFSGLGRDRRVSTGRRSGDLASV